MNNNLVIKRFLSGILLILFAFSITPRQTLHDLITNHKDSSFRSGSPHEVVNKEGFHCNCESLVAESPFTRQEAAIELIPFYYFREQLSSALYNYYSSTHFFFELRGPPTA